jgi:hypothetical protein
MPLALVLAGVALTLGPSAQHADSMRSSLKGVGEISVVVMFAPDALAKERLREDDRNPMVILGRVERKLRRGGLAANPTIFEDKSPSGLVVTLDVQCSSIATGCAVGINVNLNQRARLATSGSEMFAVTWHSEQTAILPFNRMGDAFSGLDGILDRLVSDWQAANKKDR